MPRIPPVTRDALPPDKRSIYDAIGASRGHVSGPFPVLLNSPEVASRIATLGHYLRYESILQPMIRALAIMTMAREFDCQYAWTSHDPLAWRGRKGCARKHSRPYAIARHHKD
jgi:4-carboxymuconolactone decarboxylase